MKILVTGSESQLAKSFIKKYNNSTNIHLTDKKSLDITNLNLVKELSENIRPDIIINFAAYTSVDLAETNKYLTDQINIFGPKNLSLAANLNNSTLIHFSTDYVFDGLKKNPYNENDIANPLSHYGKSKFLGEKEVEIISNKYLILRVSWLFGPWKKNFVKFAISKFKKNEDLFAVVDQFGIPTCTLDVCNFLNFIIELNNFDKLNKKYHFVNRGNVVSWYDFAKVIYKIYSQKIKTNSKIIPIKAYDFFHLKIRPSYSALNNNKLINDFKFKIDNWENSLKETINIILKQE